MLRRLLLVAIALGLFTATARPLRVALAPLPQRLAQAKCVVIGKVTEIEKKSVNALPFKGSNQKAQYQVAVIKVGESLKGDKGLTHVRVGFIAPVAPPPQQGRPVLVPSSRIPSSSLKVGQEGCFLLKPHHDQTFFIVDGYQGVIAKGKDEAAFKKQMDEVRSCMKLIADPTKGLKSKDKSEQLMAAYVLLIQHRTPRPGVRNQQLQPIDADESKLILGVLRDADWNQRSGVVNPFTVFNMLGVAPKDGFKRPRNFKEFPAAAKAWLAKNVAAFRIQGYPKNEK